MTIQAPPKLSDQATLLPAHEQATARFEAASEDAVRDSLPLLDHRARARAIPRGWPPVGSTSRCLTATRRG